MLVPILTTILVLIAFIIIYKKYKTQDEELLIPKLIGYYLLSSFKLSINSLPLPVGYAIYSVFLIPRTNRPLKKAVANLGLVAFLCGIFMPFAERLYFERERVVSSYSNNIYVMNLSADYNAIKQKLGVSQDTRVENFEADFDKSGSIKRLRYNFLTSDGKGSVYYNVNYDADKKKYTIKPHKVDQWLQYNSLISEEQFFYGLKYLDLKNTIPEEEYPFYTIKCGDYYSNWGVKNFDNYLITDKGPRKLKVEELPVSGYVFWIYGNKKISESNPESYSSDSNKAYILHVIQ